jgi:nucleoside-diphosphate-sugar epimerase
MILITGATGLVGSFIAKDLLDEGVSFKSLKREHSTIPEILKNHENYSQIEWINGDIRESISLDEAFESVDGVIHCAAMVSFYSGDYNQMKDINVQGTINMVNHAQKHSVKKFVHISSIAALGRSEKNTTISEDTKWIKSANDSRYAWTKHLGELEVWRASEEGLPVIILNPTVILGPSNWNNSSTRLFKYVWEERGFYPKGALNYIDVRDVSRIAIKMLKSEVDGERFILNSGKVLYKTLLQLIAKTFDKKAPSIEVKRWMLSAGSIFEYLKSIFTREKPLITPETIRLSRTDFNYRNDKIKSFVDFEFMPLEDTIVWTCKELRS